MQWFSGGVLYDTGSNAEDQQRFVSGILWDGPGPLGTELEPLSSDIDETAPFATSDSVANNYTTSDIDETAPFALQDAGVSNGGPEYGTAGIVIVTEITADAIRSAVTSGDSEFDITLFAHGEYEAGGAADEADIDQTAAFATSDGEAESDIYASSADIDETGPFSLVDSVVSEEGLLQTLCPTEWMSNGVLWNTGQLITIFTGGVALRGCTQQATLNQAAIGQVAPFAETNGYAYLYQEANVDQLAPFTETRSTIADAATDAAIDNTSPWGRLFAVAVTDTLPTGGGCGRSNRKRRRCCCCGQMIDRAFPVVMGTSHGASSTNEYTHTVLFPAGIETNDLILVAFCSDARVPETIPTLSQPANWTLLTSYKYYNLVRMSYFYSWAIGGEQQIVLNTNNQEAIAYVVYRIIDADITTAPVASAQYLTTDTHPDPPLHNPWGGSSSRILWVAGTGWDAYPPTGILGACTGYPSGYDNGVTDGWASNQGVGVALATRKRQAATENPGQFTLSSVGFSISHTIAVQGALI